MDWASTDGVTLGASLSLGQQLFKGSPCSPHSAQARIVTDEAHTEPPGLNWDFVEGPTASRA